MSRTDPRPGMGGEVSARGVDSGAMTPRRMPWLLLIVVLTTMAVGRYLEYRVNGVPPDGWLLDSLMGVAFMSFPAIGALIASRRRNAFGWLLLGIGAAAAVLVAASGYAAWRVPAGDTDLVAVLAAWIYQWLWLPLILSVPTFAILLFPTGTYPSPRWRWVGRSTLVLIAALTVPAMLEDRLIVEHEPRDGVVEFASLDNPIGVSIFTDVEQQLGFLFVGVLPLVLLSLASLVFRYRAGDAVERQQMKWVGLAALLFGIAVMTGDLVGLSELLFPVFLVLLPASMAISILKYRLYEIDVIVNRTLVYGSLTAILVLAYLGIVFVLQNLLSGLTQDSDLAVAASTLAVAAMFRPLRGRVQGFIDRRFYRRKYDAQHTLESFTARLRDEVDLDHLARDLTATVHDSMQPAHVSVWLRVPQAGEVSR